MSEDMKFDNGSKIKAVSAHCKARGQSVDLHEIEDLDENEVDDRSKDKFEVLEESEIVAIVTRAVRKADIDFRDAGGTSRHWVRDWFLPYLRQENVEIVKVKGETKCQAES